MLEQNGWKDKNIVEVMDEKYDWDIITEVQKKNADGTWETVKEDTETDQAEELKGNFSVSNLGTYRIKKVLNATLNGTKQYRFTVYSNELAVSKNDDKKPSNTTAEQKPSSATTEQKPSDTTTTQKLSMTTVKDILKKVSKINLQNLKKRKVRITWKKVKNADGYQYQIYDGTKVLANKNSANTTCILKKVPTMGFARVRSYTVQNGKKSYSRWSNEMRMPPVKLNKDNIKLIKITGKKKTVTAQFGNLKYSDGFDCVLKNADSGENIVLKNQKKNTVTFKNIKPGVYYLKAHAYTLLNGIKQFGVWSDNKKVVVK